MFCLCVCIHVCLLVCVCVCPDEERVLVELACGAALAAVYCGVIQRLQGEGRLPVPLAGPLVMIVCGGSSINQAQLEHLRKVLNR